MSLDIIRDIWDGLNPHIHHSERADAADMLVNLLIDNDYEVSEIKGTFKGDKDIASALKYYQEKNDPNEDLDEPLDDYMDDEEEW